MRVAFLGLGRMGAAMAAHIPGRHDLVVWNRTPGRAGDLVAAGAREAGTVGEAVGDADVVVLMLFGPESARDVLSEVTSAARPGTLVINSTTVGPRDTAELDETARAAGLRFVDAPVVGTVGPAREGTLRVLVGATDTDAAAAEPVLSLFGTTVHVGGVGDATARKVVVNLSLALATAAAGEVIRLGEDLGVDRTVLLDMLSAGALGWIVGYKRNMIASGDFQPAAFTLDALGKDIGLALDAAGIELPLSEIVAAAAREMSAAGQGDHDFSVLAQGG